MKRLLLTLLLLCSASFSAAQSLTAEQAWIRLPPPNATMLAGYARLSNPGDTELVIVEARSTAFAGVEVHETIHEDGIAKMRPVPRLVIPAHGAVVLEPGSMHLMLMQPRRKLRLGDSVVVDLMTADGDPLPMVLTVRSMPDDGEHAHEGHDAHEHH